MVDARPSSFISSFFFSLPSGLFLFSPSHQPYHRYRKLVEEKTKSSPPSLPFFSSPFSLDAMKAKRIGRAGANRPFPPLFFDLSIPTKCAMKRKFTTTSRLPLLSLFQVSSFSLHPERVRECVEAEDESFALLSSPLFFSPQSPFVYALMPPTFPPPPFFPPPFRFPPPCRKSTSFR